MVPRKPPLCIVLLYKINMLLTCQCTRGSVNHVTQGLSYNFDKIALVSDLYQPVYLKNASRKIEYNGQVPKHVQVHG